MSSRALVSLLCAVLAGSAAAQDDARDEDIFGPVEVEESAAGDPSEPDESSMFGAEPFAEPSDIDDRLAAIDDTLAIGGSFYGRLDWTAYTERKRIGETWTAPVLLDVYLDGRPNDRVRAYFRGRLIHRLNLPEGAVDLFGNEVPRSRVALDQLWLKFDLWRTVWVTVGQQPIRWGAGRFWNPTDFLNQQFRDPLAVFDERLGTTLLKLHLPVESLGWNLYGVVNLSGAGRPEDIGGAFRVEALFGTTEVSATAAVRNHSVGLGADFSAGVWLFDVRGEFALLHGVTDPYYEGEFILPTDSDGNLDLPNLIILLNEDPPTLVDRSDEWIVRGVLGAEIGFNYSDEDAVYVGAEYFYNGYGYDDASLYLWLAGSAVLPGTGAEAGAFRPFYLGRHYAGVYVFLPEPGPLEDTGFLLTTVGNLSDNSYLTRLDFSLIVLTHLRFNAYAAWHWGDRGEFLFEVRLPPMRRAQADAFFPPPGSEAADEFARGFHLPPPRLDLGVGLTVSL